jgi:NO-binding membrane sensor protein with MHYT domain
MAVLHHFTYGVVTPILAYALSVLGSLLGLVATAHAQSTTRHRARWLVLAAWAIGGTGIWTMHFMAMIGFSVAGSAVRYDIAITVASWLIAVVVVGVGLFVVGMGRPSPVKVLLGGPLTGVGVAAMHYTGMDAMRVDGHLHYDRTRVIASVVIAVVAATAALWFTVRVRRPAAIAVSALIMGVAVCGMHFTGMSALRIQLDQQTSPLAGTEPMTFLVPILVFVILVVVALAYALLAAPARTDREFADRLRARATAPRPLAEPVTVPPTSAFAVPSERTGRRGRPAAAPTERTGRSGRRAAAPSEPMLPSERMLPGERIAAPTQRTTAPAEPVIGAGRRVAGPDGRVQPWPVRGTGAQPGPPVAREVPEVWTGVPVSRPRH